MRDLEKKKAYNRQWYLKNREITKQRASQWKKDNPERALENNRRWDAENSEKARASKKQWADNNPEKVRAKTKRNNKNRQLERPEINRKHNQARRTRKLEQFVELVDLSVVWERDAGICCLCNLPADPAAWDLEHLVPISKGGIHAYINVGISHPLCNGSKHNKTICYSIIKLADALEACQQFKEEVFKLSMGGEKPIVSERR